MSANVERWRGYAEKAVRESGNVIPVAFVLAIIEAESRGIPSATRQEVKISDASIGLMQLLGSTAKQLGYTGPIGSKTDLSGLYDPETNIKYGVKLLSGLYKQLGSVSDAASAYNGGIRPNLGFGRKYAGETPVTICLARDGTGKCIKSRAVTKGEYGNADYVNEVMSALQTYSTAQELPAVVVTAKRETPSGSVAPEILFAIAGILLFLLYWGTR